MSGVRFQDSKVQGSGIEDSGFRVLGSEVQRLNIEPQNRRIMNRRISKGGFALLSLFYKTDRSTQKLTTGRIPYFEIRYSIFAFKQILPTLNL